MKIIAQKLRCLREERGWTQEDVAGEIGDKGITQAAYWKYENEKALPSINTLMRLAEIYDKPVTYFLGLDNGELPNGVSVEPTEKDMLRDIWMTMKRGRIIADLSSEDIQAAKDKLDKMEGPTNIELLVEIWEYLDAVERRNIYDFIRWRLLQQLERLNSSEVRDKKADEYSAGLAHLILVVSRLSPQEQARVIAYLRDLGYTSLAGD